MQAERFSASKDVIGSKIKLNIFMRKLLSGAHIKEFAFARSLLPLIT
jgi:hypothetical protein